MDWRTVVAAFVAAIGGSAAVLKLVGDQLLEGQKAHYSKELAEIAYQRSILSAEKQNAFAMGANSHMANVVFDKFIGFCEEYIDAMYDALQIQEGRKDQPLDPSDFFRIRQKWALWLNPEIEATLDKFEKYITRMSTARGVDESGASPSNELGYRIRAAIADLREVLDSERLSILRRQLVMRSLEQAPPTGTPS